MLREHLEMVLENRNLPGVWKKVQKVAYLVSVQSIIDVDESGAILEERVEEL